MLRTTPFFPAFVNYLKIPIYPVLLFSLRTAFLTSSRQPEFITKTFDMQQIKTWPGTTSCHEEKLPRDTQWKKPHNMTQMIKTSHKTLALTTTFMNIKYPTGIYCSEGRKKICSKPNIFLQPTCLSKSEQAQCDCQCQEGELQTFLISTNTLGQGRFT